MAKKGIEEAIKEAHEAADEAIDELLEELQETRMEISAWLKQTHSFTYAELGMISIAVVAMIFTAGII